MDLNGYQRGGDSAPAVNFKQTRAFLARHLRMDQEVLRNCSNDEVQKMLSQSVLESRAPFNVDRSRPPRWSWRAIPEEKHNRMPAEERRERRRSMKKYIEFISQEIQIPVDVIREMDAATFDVAHQLALARKLAGGNPQNRRQSHSAPSSPQRRHFTQHGGRSAPSSPGKTVRFNSDVEHLGPNSARSGFSYLPSSVRDGTLPGHAQIPSANRGLRSTYAHSAHLHAGAVHAHGHGQGQCATCDAKKAQHRAHSLPGTPQHTHHGTPGQGPASTPQQYQQVIHVDQNGVPVSMQYVPIQPKQELTQPTAAHAPQHGHQLVHQHQQVHQHQHAPTQPAHSHSPAHHMHQAPSALSGHGSVHSTCGKHGCSHGHRTPTGQSPHVRPVEPSAAVPPPMSYSYVDAQGMTHTIQSGPVAHAQPMPPVHVQGGQALPPMQMQGAPGVPVVAGHPQHVQYVPQQGYVVQADPRYVSPSMPVLPNPAVPSPAQNMQGTPILVHHPDPSATAYPLPPTAHSHHH